MNKVFVVLILSLAVLPYSLAEQTISQNNWADDVQLEQSEPLPLPVAEVSAFTQAFKHIKELYVEDVTDQQLLEGAIQGMLNTLDPHSSYLDSAAMEALTQSTEGRYGGLGIEVDGQGELVRIVTPLDDTPAFRAGIKPGDKIVKVNGLSVIGLATQKVIDMLRGEIGSSVQLSVLRKNSEKPIDFNLTREQIDIKSVKAEWLQPGYAYLRISQFSGDTPAEVNIALQQFNNEMVNGMVIDLRNNPGGLLSAAVTIADTFLEQGLIVSTQGRSVGDEQYFANPGDFLKGKPIVVLINNGSASASEIVAGALQDHKRAVLLGSSSFGKGSIQVIRPLQTGTAIKLTTSRYYSPTGRPIQGHGLIPDIEVPAVNMSIAEQELGERETDLYNTLKSEQLLSEQVPDEAKQKRLTTQSTQKMDKLIQSDYQLYQAITVLKGVYAFHRR